MSNDVISFNDALDIWHKLTAYGHKINANINFVWVAHYHITTCEWDKRTLISLDHEISYNEWDTLIKFYDKRDSNYSTWILPALSIEDAIIYRLSN